MNVQGSRRQLHWSAARRPLGRWVDACGRPSPPESRRMYLTDQRAATYNAKVIWVSTSAASAHSEESDTPRRRTPLRIGNWAASNSALIDAKIEQSETGAAHDRLRVMIWKSANLILIVTVRPRTPLV